MNLDAHVVSHTHWDREWYLPLERFRQRLVALVDELLDDPPATGESFLLDGQTIVLEDYLAVRPERAAELEGLLRAGRLEAGPWHVLADELIPSGEGLTRNLLAGRRVLRRLGATSPPVLYCPDSFGHPAALPSLAAGFCLPLVVLWRGLGGRRSPDGDTFVWRAPSGEQVVVHHLPRDGYEYGSHLPGDDDGAASRWRRMRDELAARSATGVLLIPNGADHHARQRDFRAALDAIERAGSVAVDHVHRSSLTRFAESLLAGASGRSLPRLRGELRDSYGYTWTLPGTLATRAHQKRANARAERLLLRDCEPWAALAARRGRSRRPLVEGAWRTLLEAHPHDTLCGCSIDDVADAMELRLRSATHQAEGIRDDALLDLIGHDPVAAREARDRWVPLVVMRNPAARRRAGVAIVDVEEFVADVRVGPRSAPDPEPVTVAPTRVPRIFSLGAPQMLARRIAHSRTESPRHYPDDDLVAVTRVAVWLPEVPACGVASYPLGAPGRGARTSRPAPVATTQRSLDNGVVSLVVGDDGRVSLREATAGRVVPSLLSLIDEADVGDSYTPAPRPRDHSVVLRRVRRVHRGPLVGALALDYRVVDASARSVDAELTVTLSLHAGEPFVRIGVEGVNRRENHRLRLCVHGDVPAAEVWADAAFGPVRRTPIVIHADDARMEHAPPTAPLHRYVSAFGATAGFTVLSDGLAQYEPLADGGFAVTLVRAVGELSRNDLPERPGHAGWPTPVPGAQCLGPFAAGLAVMMHGPRDDATIDAIERAADDFLLPLAGSTLRSALAVPAPVEGPELSGRGLACSAIKESEDGKWLVLRCVNLLDSAVAGAWHLPFAPRQACLARLDETIMSELVIDGRRVAFDAPPCAIVTVLVR